MAFHKTVLPNGLTIFVENVSGSPDAVILLGTRKGGSIYNPCGFHFIEHLLTKRGGARTAREFSDSLDQLGVDFGAHTADSSLEITGRFKPEALSAVLRVFSKISGQSFLSERDFGIEKGVILVERKRSKDSAEEILDNLLHEFLFNKHPLARPTEGTESEITALRFEDLTALVKNYFNPANLIIIIVSPIEISEVLAAVTENFAGLKKRRFVCPRIKRAKIKTTTPAVYRRKKIINAAYLIWAFPAPALSSKDYISMLVLVRILEMRMFNESRNKKGLSYDVSHHYFNSPVIDFVTISADCLPENVEVVSEIVEREFRKLRRRGVQESEFYDTLNVLIKKAELNTANPLERAECLYTNMVITGSSASLDDRLTRLREGTFANVRSLAKRFLRPSLVKQVILTPPTKRQLVQPSSDKI